MKIDARTVMRHPSGQPLMSTPDEKDDKGEIVKPGEPMTVGEILAHVALQPGSAQKPYSSREQVIRYSLALGAWKAKENDEDSTLQISRATIKVIEDDLNRIYSPVAAGQLLLMLGYRVEDEEDDDEERRERLALARARK